MAKKQAKFFCENCGEEVAQNARFCNKCGRFFSAVRCPQCGKVGSSHSFINGCPACGYAEKGKGTKSRGKKNDSSTISRPAKNHFYLHKPKYTNNNDRKKNNSNSNSLPLWIYILTLCVLAIMIALVIKCSY